MTTWNGLWDRMRSAGNDFYAYLGSAEFEEGLNELGARLGIDFSGIDRNDGRGFRFRHRRLRIKAKAGLILDRTGSQVLKAAGVGSTIGMISRNPQIILAATVLFGGVQAISIAAEAYDSFASVRKEAATPVLS